MYNKIICGILFFLLFLFFDSSLMAQELQYPDNSEHICGNHIDIPEMDPKHRAASFAQSREERWKDVEEKRISIRYMKLLQQEADKHRQANNYMKAYIRYYDANLYSPKTLLIFKFADMRLKQILLQQKICSKVLKYAVDDYKLGFEFYLLEKNKSVSENCLEMIQQKTNCFQDLYKIYEETGHDVWISKDDILQCTHLARDIFQYENYCE